jgi:hypothetical protein
MPKRAYHIEPQRNVKGEGYVPCLPHQASRFNLIETTTIPSRSGRRAMHIKRSVEIFSGPGAERLAEQRCARLTGHTGPRPIFSQNSDRQLWGRSLTIREYDEMMDRKREEGSF